MSCLAKGLCTHSQRDLYSLSIGGGRRAEVTYSLTEPEDRDWSIDLTIGKKGL